MTVNEKHRRRHALHNESACKKLHESGEYPDWVLTTAFYAALHFVRYKIFPIILDGKNYPDFDDFCYVNRNNKLHGNNAHARLIRLSELKLKPIAAHYRLLHEWCDNARYVDYQVDGKKVGLAVAYLEKIKKHCNTNKP